MFHETVIQQLQFETASWERLLAFFLQENVFFKTRLAQVLDSASNNGLVEPAERFQEDFLEQDRILTFLISEVKAQRTQLSKKAATNGAELEPLMERQIKLRSDIKWEEERFHRLKEEFALYLSTAC